MLQSLLNPKRKQQLKHHVQMLFNKKYRSYQMFKSNELEKYQDLFDKVEKLPLTNSQREAVILDEMRTLIIAAAGSGKTSVIVGKCAYLLQSNRAKEDEIFLLAFNNGAKQEMLERIEKRVGKQIKTKTFHSLGLEILDNCLERKKSIDNPLDSPRKVGELVNLLLHSVEEDKQLQIKFEKYISQFIYPSIDEPNRFQTKGQYDDWIRRNRPISLKGDWVKSNGELVIANHLFKNGIEYTYENKYQSCVEEEVDFRYKPDFHLTGTNIYIEYYGIDRNKNTAPYIDKDKYNGSILWKRSAHKKHGTILIELHYYDLKENKLIELLNKKLTKYGLELNPRSFEEILEIAVERQYLRKLQNLLINTTNIVKSNNIKLDSLHRKAFDERSALFFELFEIFYSLYQGSLESKNSIDFIDMINMATTAVKNNEFVHKFKYIIVDEYQDISPSRFNLIKALLDQYEEAKLFCVGDDWQSIYRFAGSCNSYMTKFSSNFTQNSASHVLDMTFRYNAYLADISQRFVEKNPSQIKKSFSTHNNSSDQSIFIHEFKDVNSENLLEVVNILKDIKDESDSLLILARYSKNLPDIQEKKKLKKIFSGDIEYQTIHSSKGVEASYVIIVDALKSGSGFPSKIEDDPIIQRISPIKEKYSHAEERRLFYVALTRAKKQVHLIVTDKHKSDFVLEIEKIGNVRKIAWVEK